MRKILPRADFRIKCADAQNYDIRNVLEKQYFYGIIGTYNSEHDKFEIKEKGNQ